MMGGKKFFYSTVVLIDNFPCSFEKKIKQKMRGKYKDICVCQAKSIRDGFFCSFPLLTLIIFSNLGPNFVFWNVNFGFDHKLCIFAKKKTKIGQI